MSQVTNVTLGNHHLEQMLGYYQIWSSPMDLIETILQNIYIISKELKHKKIIINYYLNFIFISFYCFCNLF